VLKNKIWANFQRITELFTKKIVKKLLKIWSWDPGYVIRKKHIPDPGSRGQKGTGSLYTGKSPKNKTNPVTAGYRISRPICYDDSRKKSKR
jgi:hypothetical protein